MTESKRCAVSDRAYKIHVYSICKIERNYDRGRERDINWVLLLFEIYSMRAKLRRTVWCGCLCEY